MTESEGEFRGRIMVGTLSVPMQPAPEQSDPRQGIEALSDDTPILMLPVRVETRFAPGRELWVRIYPDDCSLDSFQPELSESELTDAQRYWLGWWQARGDNSQQRAAWAALVDAQGAGRAGWIVQTYRPANVATQPTDPKLYDLILTIPTEVALAPNEADPLATYWTSVFVAPKDASIVANALADLAEAVGPGRAAQLVHDYQPSNIDTELAPGLVRKNVRVHVSYVVFPANPATTDDAWTAPARVRLLPQRFVFIGYVRGAAPLVAVGNPVPADLQAGPDPTAQGEAQLRHDDYGELHLPDPLRWIADFDRAVEVGMAMRIKLNQNQAKDGFDRVLVLGVRLDFDPQAVRTELQELLEHHAHSRTGLAVLAQGVPTNNTEATPAGYSRVDDPDATFERPTKPRYSLTNDWRTKSDGQWLAEYLGLAPEFFAHTLGADGTDQLTERAMNTALWPATLGYWMQTMLSPIFSEVTVAQTREFFLRFVSGAGAVPALRIGRQPYGILPTTALSRLSWFEHGGLHSDRNPFLVNLSRVLKTIRADWHAQVAKVARVDDGTPDPHQSLLDIVGLHPGSVEWSQRYAETLSMLSERLRLAGLDPHSVIAISVGRLTLPKLLNRLGYDGKAPAILDYIFSGLHRLLTGPVVEDGRLSETAPLRPATVQGHNYLRWLADNGRAGLLALYGQGGFAGGQPPTALLYLLLRHALLLGYHEVSVRLHATSGLYTPEQARAARSDAPFLHIRQTSAPSESRYQPLLVAAPQITGDPHTSVAAFITVNLGALEATGELTAQFDALAQLENRPTAQLERAFADQIDCCSYRLDAWLLGLVHYQLALMRGLTAGTAARTGVHVGAYAWLENLRPQRRTLRTFTPDDASVARDFLRYPDEAKRPQLRTDSTNQGYVHAPSLNHAVTAAVLRNAYASAEPDVRELTAINLTSQRVRAALAVLQGIRAGQGMSDLLGYQFERGLHDRHGFAEVDQFIYALRKAFPLRADRMSSTRSEPGRPIEEIEARNVIDGLALVEQIKASKQTAYPFGRTDLPKADNKPAAAITAEAGRLLDTHDAVADLALAEGVHQAVLGNYDRVASTYDAYAHGRFPPEPEIVRTPYEGLALTSRVALHLPADTGPTTSPITQLAMTPRAQADPALNAWLAGVLPPLDQIGCVVSFRSADTGLTVTGEINLRQLDLQPLDLLMILGQHGILGQDGKQSRSELDDRIVRRLRAQANPRPDTPVVIEYLVAGGAPISVFQVLPLVRAARRLVFGSRPLDAADLVPGTEARSADTSAPIIARERVDPVHAGLQGVRADLATLRSQLAAALADVASNRETLLSHVDDYVEGLATVLARGAAFGLAQAGWGFAYDAQRQAYAAILRSCAELGQRWDHRLAAFNAALARYAALPPEMSDEQRMRILSQAERAISTQPLTPPPATPTEYAAALQGAPLAQFQSKRAQFAGIATTTRAGVAQLRADVLALLPISAVDNTGFTITAAEDGLIRFIEHAGGVLDVLLTEVDRRLATAGQRLADYQASAAPPERAAALQATARALLGDACPLIPQFTVDSTVAAALTAALSLSRSGALLSHLTSPADPATAPVDFPVDTWLHGVARVREKLHALEQLQLMTGAFGVAECELEALQLPPDAGVGWLGLELPPGTLPDTDRLLYTAHFPAGDLPAGFDPAAPMCGLLLDEWTELIPASTAETGLTFHYDRPNSEAPQAMLLVTPTQFRGGWRWQDLVDALNETLELAKLRALEPDQIEKLPYAAFLPATMMATQLEELTIALELSLNNVRLTTAGDAT